MSTFPLRRLDPAPPHLLTQEEAQQRSKIVRDVTYSVEVVLEEKQETYKGFSEQSTPHDYSSHAYHHSSMHISSHAIGGFGKPESILIATGKTAVTFSVAQPPSPVFLDFSGKTLSSIRLNGDSAAPGVVWDRISRLTIGPEALLAENTLEVEYENEFDHGGTCLVYMLDTYCSPIGEGFHKHVDSADGREYYCTDHDMIHIPPIRTTTFLFSFWSLMLS